MLFHRKKNTIMKKRRKSSKCRIPRQITSLIKVEKQNCERAALCILKKKRIVNQASLTVEAAVILPLFLMAMLTLVCVIDVCKVHVEQQTEMMNRAKKLGIYAYAAEKYYEEEYIDLYQAYPCELAVSLIPGYRINLALRGRVHTWTGRSKAECEADKEAVQKEMVYITENQGVYHTDSGCSYLELSIRTVPQNELSAARNRDGKRYGACEKCCTASDTVNFYYISASGRSYHTVRDCSGLSRKVKMVLRQEMTHLPCCSRCQGG